MADLSKASINKKYDQLRAQLKSGDISQEKFKAAANRLYNLAHGKKSKVSAKVKPSATSKAKPTPKAKPKPPANSGITPAPKAKPVPKSKPKTAKESLYQPGKRYGGAPIKGDDGTSRRSKIYAGVLPGTPEKKEKKKAPKRIVRGAAARRNRATKNKPTTATGSEKRIKVAGKNVTMVYNGSKWVPKNK